MQIVHFGVYDEYTELEYGNYAALSSTTFQTVQEDLQGHLNAQVVRCKDNLQFDWAQPELDRAETVLAAVTASKSVEDLENSEDIHFEIIDLLGEFDANTTDMD